MKSFDKWSAEAERRELIEKHGKADKRATEDLECRLDRKMPGKCPYCGSDKPYSMDVSRDWPRCPDCQGC